MNQERRKRLSELDFAACLASLRFVKESVEPAFFRKPDVALENRLGDEEAQICELRGDVKDVLEQERHASRRNPVRTAAQASLESAAEQLGLAERKTRVAEQISADARKQAHQGKQPSLEEAQARHTDLHAALDQAMTALRAAQKATATARTL